MANPFAEQTLVLALLVAVGGCGSRTQLVDLTSASDASATPPYLSSSPTCSSSARAPLLLYQAPDAEMGQISLDGERIYWSEVQATGGVVARSLSKCGAAAVLLGDVLDDGDLVLPFDGNAFWVDSRGRVVRAPSGGGTVISTEISANAIGAVDGEAVYGFPDASGNLFALSLTGGAPALLGTPSWPIPIAVDTDHVFYPVGPDPYNAQLAAVPKGGGPLEVLSSIPQSGLGDATPTNIVIDDTNVYWGSGQQVIVSVLKSGGSQVILADGRGSVAVDETYVYFFSLDEALSTVIVSRILKGGGTAERVVDAGALAVGFGSLAVDARSLYWVELYAGAGGNASRMYKLDL
jgi:hypothetical protein